MLVGLRNVGDIQSSSAGHDIFTFCRGSNERREVVQALQTD
jgi:hypothetical protein